MQAAPRSPFASPSWEPRFAIEHHREEALRSAVELWQICQHDYPYRRWTSITHVLRGTDYLLVKHPVYTRHGYEELPAPVPIDELPAWILSWLRTAQYPDQPNFDGAEAAGFRAFWAHYGSTECEAHLAYGSLVVMPAWIEIHK